MAAKPMETKYIDIPELAETFADQVENFFYDGTTLRIEFCVKRVEQFHADKPATGRRHPVCRLVLPNDAAIDLMNKLQQLAGAMEQKGLVKRGEPKGVQKLDG